MGLLYLTQLGTAISGYIVKIDAIGCHKQIVKLITQQNAGYVIT
ncbi:hypothetical protein [Nostoc sp.]